MTRTVFRDFDEFADAINGIAGRFVPTGRTHKDWWVEVVGVGRLAVQQVQIGGASTFAGDGRDRSLTLGIPMTEPGRIRIDGDSLGEDSFILVKEDQPFTFAARQPTLWAGFVIPMNHAGLAPELLQAMGGHRWKRGQETHTRSQLGCMTQMRRLITRVCLDDRTQVSWSNVTGQALEDAILAAVSSALEASSQVVDHKPSLGRPRHDRDRVIAQALDLIHASQGKPLLLRDLRAATRVSERSLRYIFQEYFGVAPMKLLRLRQLHEVRGALLEADPHTRRVADIVAQFGVWDVSLFARNYKALYGELPSQTLRRFATARREDKISTETWLRYAARRFARTLDEAEHTHRAEASKRPDLQSPIGRQ